MPEENQEQQITPTPTTDIGTPASNEQLEAMQAQVFGRKKEKEKERQPEGQEQEQEQSKDSAQKLFEKTTESDKKLLEDGQKNQQEGEDGEGGDEEFQPGSFIDVSKFMEGDSDPSDGKKKEEEEQAPDPDLDKEDNLKNLRKIAGNFKQERNEAQAKIAELEAELQNRPDTNALQSKIQKLEARVEELQPYELVFGLHNNPEFKAKYIDGAQSLVEEMRAIASDYGVDETVVPALLSATNRKEIDDLLSDYFSSTEARSDLKALKQKHDGLQKEKKQFEEKPQEAFSKFEESQAERKAERMQKRDARFQDVSGSAWSAALAANKEISEGQRINELIEIPGQKDHNERVVRPTLKSANDMYNAGLQHIEKMIRNEAVIDGTFASWFASIVQQAAATQMLNFSRSAIYEQLLELKEAQQQERNINRPGVVTPSRSRSASDNGAKLSGKERAAQIFREVQEETAGQ